jgi:hypothetical protein
MPIPRFEVPSGTIDGVNTVFTTVAPYQAGTTAVFLNGVLLRPDLDDGWTETDPAAGTLTLKEAPRDTPICPDVLQVFYLDTSPQLPETVLERLKGRLSLSNDLTGRLSGSEPLSGVVEAPGGLAGSLGGDIPVRGAIEPVVALVGRLESC